MGCRCGLGYHAALRGGRDFPAPYLSGVDLEALPFVGSAHLIVDALRAMPHQLTNSVGLSMPPVPPFDANPNPNLTLLPRRPPEPPRLSLHHPNRTIRPEVLKHTQLRKKKKKFRGLGVKPSTCCKELL